MSKSMRRARRSMTSLGARHPAGPQPGSVTGSCSSHQSRSALPSHSLYPSLTFVSLILVHIAVSVSHYHNQVRPTIKAADPIKVPFTIQTTSTCKSTGPITANPCIMCLFTSTPTVDRRRNVVDPPPHRSRFSAHPPPGVVRLPRGSTSSHHRSHHHHHHQIGRAHV